VDHDQAAAGDPGQDIVGAGFDSGLANSLPRDQCRIRLELLGGRLRDITGDVRGLLAERVDARRLRLDGDSRQAGDDVEQALALLPREIPSS
jgi:hypothetical protein